MSLDKAIFYGKEKRKQYRKSKSFDKSCRNHGDCDYCRKNRMYRHTKRELESRENLKDFIGNDW